MKYTVRHRVVTDYLRDVEAERAKRDARQRRKEMKDGTQKHRD